MTDTAQKKERMGELIRILDKAARAYYQDGAEIMPNFEYDRLYDELLALEKETGIALAGSPTAKVGYEVVSDLPRERHERPMLSLDKTKDREALKAFLGDKEALISWKLDGLTIVLTYENGSLQKAVTRGNGEVGEVVTPNARTFRNLPLAIPYKGRLVLRGEAVISYADFEEINREIEEAEAKYKNPRNLCSGSVRQKNSEITAKRRVQFYAFSLVEAQDVDFANSRSAQFRFLAEQGFAVVEHYLVNAADLDDRIDYFAEAITGHAIPSDGLVLTYEDLAYSRSLGTTAKYPRDSFAFKWADETADTHILTIEWSPSRTGLINPVAIFEPVELEGTTVSRASLHNVSIVKSLAIGTGDMVRVYKANMIIPQIEENLTRSGPDPLPETCPACGGKTVVRQVAEAEALYCENPQCPVKQIKAFALFASRDALDVNGMSEATLEKFTQKGFIREFRDLFHLDEHKEAICRMEGFGEKSYANLQESIEKARRTTPAKLLYALGIPNVGLATAKLIMDHFGGQLEEVRSAKEEELALIDGVGPVIAEAIRRFFGDPENNAVIDRLLPELVLEEEEKGEQTLTGLTFVITGSVYTYANRNALKADIEAHGGKTASAVSANTDYLINNDSTSTSSKNKKAQELGVPIITEDAFIALMENGNIGSTKE